MAVGIMKIEIYFNYCRSLKEKRAVLKKIIYRSREKFNLSAAEIGYQDKWQRTLLEFAYVGSNLRLIDKTLNSILAFIEDNLEGYIVNVEREII